MNENKKGKSYSHPDSFVLVVIVVVIVVGYIRVYFHLPYSQTEGLIKATVGERNCQQIKLQVIHRCM